MVKNLASVIISIILLAVFAPVYKAQNSPQLEFLDKTNRKGLDYFYSQALDVYKKRELKLYLDYLNRAIEVAPNHIPTMSQLARANTLLGNKQEAFGWMERIVNAGIYSNVEDDPELEPIRLLPEFKSVAEKIQRLKLPVKNSKVAFSVKEKDLIAESIAYDAVTKSFFIGSIYKRKVVEIDKFGKEKDFAVEKQDGMWGVLGIKVDAKNRILWVNTAAGPELKPDDGSAALFKYDLKTRKMIKKYVLDNKSHQAHLFNDLVINSKGDIFLTDSLSGTIYTVTSDKDELEILINPGEFFYPNGITISSDEKYLFVADWRAGVSLIDIEAKKFAILPHPENITLAGIDGLYFYRNSLIAVQNGSKPERVVRFFLSERLDRVESEKILEVNNPLFIVPTTGLMLGDNFYYIANSQLDNYKDGQISSAEQLKPISILSISFTPPKPTKPKATKKR